MAYLEVSGNYGRDYRAQKDVLADWEANKDFRVLEGGPYGVATCRSDVEVMHARGEVTGVVIRYDRGKKVMNVKILPKR